jgi:hypothetical protein
MTALSLGPQDLPLLRLVSYNCNPLVRTGRLSDTLTRIRKCSAIGLQGTCVPAGLHDGFVRTVQDGFVVFNWPFLNRSAGSSKKHGVSIALKRRLFREEHVRKVFSPPEVMAGRADAVRVRNHMADYLFICASFPSECITGAQKKTHPDPDELDSLPTRAITRQVHPVCAHRP